MKKLVPWLPLFALCLAFGAERIQWMFHGTEILTIRRGETRLEFGLRDDGVVVWREITNITNSPSEKPKVWFQGVPMETITNWNFMVPGSTNWHYYLNQYPESNIILN